MNSKKSEVTVMFQNKGSECHATLTKTMFTKTLSRGPPKCPHVLVSIFYSIDAREDNHYICLLMTEIV